MHVYHRSAFSLVELSIVLVILGLLVGGILAGQSLIRAAELRAVQNEFQRYTVAVGAFRDKYMAIPGDMSNATSFWGVQGDTTACKTTASTTTLTCDGTGDGNVDESPSNPFAMSYERFAFWKHLSNAGLVEGTYSGVAGPDGARDVVIGTNAPRSRISNAGWSVAYSFPNAGDTNWYAAQGGNFFLFGGETGVASNWGLVLKPEESWNIDVKVDDGRPSFGKVRAHKPAPSTIMPNCTTSATESVAEYNLSNSTIACALIQFFRF